MKETEALAAIAAPEVPSTTHVTTTAPVTGGAKLATLVAVAAALVAGAGGLAGCASMGGAGAETNAGEAPPADSFAQIRRGEAAFGKACAQCHGALGQGTSKGPGVTGMRALPLEPPPRARYRRSRFVTARDVYDFIRANMPPNDPGSLSELERVAVVAYQISTGPTSFGPQPLTLESLSTLALRR
jgi:mono/diheme cytochrome c family protein